MKMAIFDFKYIGTKQLNIQVGLHRFLSFSFLRVCYILLEHWPRLYKLFVKKSNTFQSAILRFSFRSRYAALQLGVILVSKRTLYLWLNSLGGLEYTNLIFWQHTSWQELAISNITLTTTEHFHSSSNNTRN